jgi:hypothetical protein
MHFKGEINAQRTKEAQITFQYAPLCSCSFILTLFEFSEKIKKFGEQQ